MCLTDKLDIEDGGMSMDRLAEAVWTREGTELDGPTVKIVHRNRCPIRIYLTDHIPD